MTMIDDGTEGSISACMCISEYLAPVASQPVVTMATDLSLSPVVSLSLSRVRFRETGST